MLKKSKADFGKIIFLSKKRIICVQVETKTGFETCFIRKSSWSTMTWRKITASDEGCVLVFAFNGYKKF